jgi:hypothetical protein
VLDESPTQLIGEVRQPIPAAPGQLERYDCEYRRNGTANLFVFLDAHQPWRTVKVTDSRTARDFAQCTRDLDDLHCPKAELIRVVLDNCRPTRRAPSTMPSPHPRPTASCVAGVPLHAQARFLAQGRNRDRRPANQASHSRVPRMVSFVTFCGQN